MKIQTSNINNFSRKVRMKNEDISWNSKGVTEVEDKIGEVLIKNFEDIFPEGEIPKKEIVVIEEDEDIPYSKQTEKLKVAVKIAEDKATVLLTENKSLKEKLAVAEVDAQNWKDEYTKLANGDKAEKTPADVEKVGESVDEEEMKVLNGMSLTELKATAKEMGIYEDVEDKRVPESFIKAILNAPKGE